MSREDSSLAVAETNGEAITLADTAEVDRVAINEELAFFTVGKSDDLLASPAEFEHGTVLVLLLARNGATAEHVSWAHVAASH